jgi:hypothetical protein
MVVSRVTLTPALSLKGEGVLEEGRDATTWVALSQRERDHACGHGHHQALGPAESPGGHGWGGERSGGTPARRVGVGGASAGGTAAIL